MPLKILKSWILNFYQLKLGTHFKFHPLRKSTLLKTNLASADQIQTWQKVQSNAPDKFSKVEFKFSASTELGTDYNFQSIRKYTIKRTNLALLDQIQISLN